MGSVLGHAQEGPQSKHLIEAHLEVHDVATKQPQMAFEPQRMLKQATDDRSFGTWGVRFEGVDDRVGYGFADIVPGPASGELVRVVLGPQPQHFTTRGCQAVVDGAETHRYQRRVARRFAPQVVAVGGVNLGPVTTDQLQGAPGFVAAVRPVPDRTIQSESHDGAETVSHPHPAAVGGAVLLRQQPAEGLEGVGTCHHHFAV